MIPQQVLDSVSNSVANDWHQHSNGKGWVYKTARVDATAYLHLSSKVSGNALVFGNALVSGNARVSGDALVFGDARVFGDAWEFSPLYLQGSRHALTLCSLNQIAIGCHIHDIDHWLKRYKAIGKSEGYTEEQIAEYGDHITYIASVAKQLRTKGDAK